MPRPVRLILLLCAVALAAAVALPVLAAGQDDPGRLRDRVGAEKAKERSLAASIARLGRLASRLERQLAILERRRTEVQADLDRDRAELARTQEALREERARLVRLRHRLDVVRSTLAQRLVASYKTPRADLTTVVLTSQNISDVLERTSLLRRVHAQDRRILLLVRAARRDATRQARRLAREAERRKRLVAALRTRRDALASMTQAVAARRSALLRTRAARAEALRATRARRKRVERRLREVEAELARAAAAGGARSSGPWAIPWSVVQCESGGQNLPPNHAGASGYYQILPETWKIHGGSGPAAWKASKAEQDRVARRIWGGGQGPAAWVCAGLVGLLD